MFEGESAKAAFRRLARVIRRECIEDRIRRRWWGNEYHLKPGYVRRQQKFFAKVNARSKQEITQMLRYRGVVPW